MPPNYLNTTKKLSETTIKTDGLGEGKASDLELETLGFTSLFPVQNTLFVLDLLVKIDLIVPYNFQNMTNFRYI